MKIRVICGFTLFFLAFLTLRESRGSQSVQVGTNSTQTLPATVPVSSTTNLAPQISVGPFFIGQAAENEKHDDNHCAWLGPLLDLVKCLLWPSLLAGVVYYYRKDLRKLLSNLESAKTPAGDFNFRQVLASKQMDNQSANLLNENNVNEVVKTFADHVSKEFLKTSSWNGLKIIYLCSECQKRNVTFDLRQVCESDGFMSYDYAIGYIVASCSAFFLRYETLDNVKFRIIEVYETIHAEIQPAIEGRLKFVGPPTANDFNTQLDKIKAYIALLEAKGKNQ